MGGLKNTILALTTSLALSMSLFLASVLIVVAKSVHEMTKEAEKAVLLEVFLNGEIGEEAKTWAEQSKSKFEIEKIELLEKSDAETKFTELMKDDWQMQTLDRALLDIVPSSVIFQFQSGLSKDKIQKVASDLMDEAKSLVNFESAHFQSDWAAWLSDYRKSLNMTAIGFGLLMALMMYFIISNLNRSMISKYTRMIEVKYLIGATHWQVARPFIIISAALGVFAVLISQLLTSWVLHSANKTLLSIGNLLPSNILVGLNWIDQSILMLFVVLVCMASSERCVREHNL